MFPNVPSCLSHSSNSTLQVCGWDTREAPLFRFDLTAGSLDGFYRPFNDLCSFKPDCSSRKELWVQELKKGLNFKRLWFFTFLAVASTGHSHFCNTLPSFVAKKSNHSCICSVSAVGEWITLERPQVGCSHHTGLKKQLESKMSPVLTEPTPPRGCRRRSGASCRWSRS